MLEPCVLITQVNYKLHAPFYALVHFYTIWYKSPVICPPSPPETPPSPHVLSIAKTSLSSWTFALSLHCRSEAAITKPRTSFLSVKTRIGLISLHFSDQRIIETIGTQTNKKHHIQNKHEPLSRRRRPKRRRITAT